MTAQVYVDMEWKGGCLGCTYRLILITCLWFLSSVNQVQSNNQKNKMSVLESVGAKLFLAKKH